MANGFQSNQLSICALRRKTLAITILKTEMQPHSNWSTKRAT